MGSAISMDTLTKAAELYRGADDFIACLGAIQDTFSDPQQIMTAQLLAIFLENRDAFDGLAAKGNQEPTAADLMHDRGQRALKYLLRHGRQPKPTGTLQELLRS
jgi:hypothetical protein